MAILSGIGIENFRVFKEKMLFEFAPLTILTGANNSGKSSVLKALLLLEENAKTDKLIKNLDFTANENHKLGDFETSLNNDSHKKELSLQLSIKPRGEDFLEEFIKNIHVELKYDNNGLNQRRVNIDFLFENLSTNNKYDFLVKTIFLVKKYYSDYFNKLNDSIEPPYHYLIDKIKNLEIVNRQISLIDKPKLFKAIDNGEKKIDYKLFKEFIDTILNPLIIDELKKNKNAFVVAFEKKKFEFIAPIDDTINITCNGISITSILRNIDKNESKYAKYIDIINFILQFRASNPNVETDFTEETILLLNNYSKDLIENFALLFPLTKEAALEVLDEKAVINVTKILLSQYLRIVYLPAVRATQERIYAYQGRTDINRLLVQFIRNNIDTKRKDFVHKWVGKGGFNFADEVQFIQIGTYGNAIKIFKNGKELELADLGFGITQLLPILLQIALTDKDYILLEEPENSLHPNLQSKLADMLIDAQKTFGVRFIIETHSEYLIRRLQILTAEEKITPDYTSIYYFYEPERVPSDRKQVEKINILPDGRLDNDFGEGFYDMATDLEFDLLRLKNERNAHLLK